MITSKEIRSKGVLRRSERGDKSAGPPHIERMTHSDHWPEPISPAGKKRTDPDAMSENAAQAAAFLKSLGHKGRLMILCHLCDGEKTVGQLEVLLDQRQAAVSQMLARLREDGQVTARRNGKSVFYALADQRTAQVISLLYDLYCAPDAAPAPGRQLDT